MPRLRLPLILLLAVLVPASAALGAVRSGTPGPDRLRAKGVQPQQINGSGGGDTIRGGVANDVLLGVYVDNSTSVGTVDCGPGGDRVNIGYNRAVETVNCETVTKRYKR